MNFRSSKYFDYAVAFGASLIVGLMYFQPWTYTKRFVFPGGEDLVWQQAIFQIHGQVGLFGSTTHLAWPIGSDPWRLPQLGMLIGAWARVTVGWLSMGTATSVMFYVCMAVAINSLAMVFFLRSLIGSNYRKITVVLSVFLSASLFTFAHQLNLASFFVIPLSVGILCRLNNLDTRKRKRWLCLLVVTAIVSPLYWVVVMVLIYPFVLLSHAMRRHWTMAKEVSIVWAGCLAGLLTQAVIFFLAASGGPGADRSRQPWTSNYFFGSFSDLFVGSTLIKQIAPSFVSRIIPGASADLGFGLPLMITALAAVLSVLALPPIRTSSNLNLGHIRSLTLVALLYWLGGGLGNFQAMFAVVMGTISPARIWYRMILILAILGSGWILLSLKHLEMTTRRNGKQATKIVAVVLVLVLIVGGLGDLRYLNNKGRYGFPTSQQTTTPAVDFIGSHTAACRVAQFPNEANPNVRISMGWDSRIYRGMIPYILLPDYVWTHGSYDPEKLDGLANYPQTITDADFSLLEEQSYCAVLFDKEMSQMAIDQQVVIEGREISTTRKIDYEDSIYQVFLLGVS